MSELTACPPETCLCCVCALRRSEEWGAAFDTSDECCVGCHTEMAAEGWPWERCPTAALTTEEA